MYAWRGPEVEITRSSPRVPAERNWYAVTGRVVHVQVEDDGDLHIVMENTDGRRGRIVVELPVGRSWRKLRAAVFSWTNARFTLLPRASTTEFAGADDMDRQPGEEAEITNQFRRR
jgi:hypothetical protein